jgi:hypothetical protein
VHAGPWIAQHGQFFDGWGRRVGLAELPAVAAAQAARAGWAKLIGDWAVDDEPVPVDVLREVVARVHAAGGRVAVHSQQAAGGGCARLRTHPGKPGTSGVRRRTARSPRPRSRPA